MSESPTRKKTPLKKATSTSKKPGSKKEKTVTAEALKETLLEVRGLEAAILEDVVLDTDETSVPEAVLESAVTEMVEEPAAEIATEVPENAVLESSTEEGGEQSEAPEKPKKKRRKVRYAAPLGFLVLFLALTGVIALCVGGVRLVQSWTDDSELRAELSYFLNPVTQMCPDTFEDAGRAENQDALVRAAIYSISQPEYVAWLHDGDNCKFTYERDEIGRLIVPQKTVEEAFAHLFGKKKIRSHHAIGDADYNDSTKCYHVPLQYTTAGYVPVLDTIDSDGDTYTVRVAYVLAQDIRYDYRGKELEPTVEMSSYVQLFVVQQNEDDSWTILSVAEEEPELE